MMENAWLIPLFPLLSFVLLLLFGRRLKESSSYVGMVATLASLLLSIMVLIERLQGENVKIEGTWLTIGNTNLTAGFEVNQLNALMLFIVSLVSFLVHMYSRGYMHGDERMPVFYSYLGLFTFAMLSLVISPNLLQVYIFWELVGLGSFLLIGYYFFNPDARAAAKKAFIVTRIGDVGFFIGMILLFWQVGSFEYDEIFHAVETGAISPGMITLSAILIFVGAVGKSGQFPLHTWLPDAMEGPTPVSALIHAATMVAAGVYLVASLFPLFSASETAMTTVAVVGGITAIFAASIGLVQRDIKRVLAYSTVSQLGYMMLALGAAGYVAGVFHLMTHAFFKALLFLAAGSVIHAVHTQDIEEMGGLWKKMKLTAPLFLIGTLAISGFPFLSGFFSKDEILIAAYADGRYGLFWLAVAAAFFTAFYMFRLFFLVFTGEARGKQEHVHESPGVMTFPMIVLGILAVVSGYVNTPWFGTFLGDWLTEGSHALGHGHIEGPAWIMFVATGVSLAGIVLAWFMYGSKLLSRDWLVKPFPMWYKVLFNKYYVDEIYHVLAVLGSRTIAYFLQVFDTYIVGGLVKGTALLAQGIGRAGARLQDGQIQTYGTVAFFGIAVLVVIIALTGGYFG
ncbi:NADH-quinone oxidoreductase subunit L [Calidifontibacillus erzurumensis]|uniref:NADH-quinone oxidoreductase subunit L n=1 Tax=Calidifontibacillus erzurumensis TaxID=2741433 RepID=A0A8J8GDW4_9BACI|nr:NADH-quinone oxidoreductase subunit L [Calidifontibacillus erzurumensis]NSL52069.1 NADH-quinone oxidoreductase subunit L [Calidifontibacillus erzurumensis]